MHIFYEADFDKKELTMENNKIANIIQRKHNHNKEMNVSFVMT